MGNTRGSFPKHVRNSQISEFLRIAVFISRFALESIKRRVQVPAACIIGEKSEYYHDSLPIPPLLPAEFSTVRIQICDRPTETRSAVGCGPEQHN